MSRTAGDLGRQGSPVPPPERLFPVLVSVGAAETRRVGGCAPGRIADRFEHGQCLWGWRPGARRGWNDKLGRPEVGAVVAGGSDGRRELVGLWLCGGAVAGAGVVAGGGEGVLAGGGLAGGGGGGEGAGEGAARAGARERGPVVVERVRRAPAGGRARGGGGGGGGGHGLDSGQLESKYTESIHRYRCSPGSHHSRPPPPPPAHRSTTSPARTHAARPALFATAAHSSATRSPCRGLPSALASQDTPTSAPRSPGTPRTPPAPPRDPPVPRPTA